MNDTLPLTKNTEQTSVLKQKSRPFRIRFLQSRRPWLILVNDLRLWCQRRTWIALRNRRDFVRCGKKSKQEPTEVRGPLPPQTQQTSAAVLPSTWVPGGVVFEVGIFERERNYKKCIQHYPNQTSKSLIAPLLSIRFHLGDLYKELGQSLKGSLSAASKSILQPSTRCKPLY